MEKTIALSRDLDDFVFECRNRAYGAYALRKSYGNNMKKASIWGFSIFAFLMASPLIGERINKNRAAEDEKNVLVELPPPPPDVPITPPPPPPPPPPTPPVATQRFVPPVVMEDEKVTIPEEIPRMEDIKSAVSTVNQDGVDKNLPPVIDVPAPPPPPIDEEIKKPVETVETVFNTVEQVPEFPNGLTAMYKFLKENMKYPAVARENGIQGTVYIGFVVWKDGTLKDIEVRRGVAGGCSEEALRVVGLMPKWSPGKQNGKAVSVRYTIPIKFQLE